MIIYQVHFQIKIGLLCLFFAVHNTFAEGTRELRPTANSFGYLQITKHVNFTDFGHYNAVSHNQLKIRTAEAGETIYFGLNNMTEATNVFVPNVPYRIVSPSGIVVYEDVIPATGEPGNIATWESAFAGPADLVGVDGYDALSFVANEAGDYILEFDIEAIAQREVHIQLFDVTITNLAGDIVLGRLHSEGWQLSTGAHANGFDGSVYPYDSQDGTVYKVTFEDMEPFTFILNFNSYGTENTGDFIANRTSKTGIHFAPEHKIFLNPPDSLIFSTEIKSDITFLGSLELIDCGTNQYCLQFYSDQDGIIEGYIDVTGDGVFDPLVDVIYTQSILAEDTVCIPWDGRDAGGNVVNTNQIRVVSQIGSNPMHLPLYDIEQNSNGFKVEVVRPEGVETPHLFWDDRAISEGTALDGLVNLDGCEPNAVGCHRWVGRGQTSTSETINTWWYSRLRFDTIQFQVINDRNIRLTFVEGELNARDTSVCVGDSLTFYIYEDGIHYDTSQYQYHWWYEGIVLSEVDNQAAYTKYISGELEMVIQAIYNDNINCTYYDTLQVNIMPAIDINATVVDESCSQGGSIAINVQNGPPNPEFVWQNLPNTTNTVSNLHPDEYRVFIKDPLYSDNCALDTAFAIAGVEQLRFKSLQTSPSECIAYSGQANVEMQNDQLTYTYSLSDYAPQSDNTWDDLMPINYQLTVAALETPCTIDTTFDISVTTLPIDVTFENIWCNASHGRISVEQHSQDIVIVWQDGGVGFERNNLQADTYGFTLQNTLMPQCVADTLIEIQNQDYEIDVDFDIAGTAEVNGQFMRDSPVQFTIISEPDTAILTATWDFDDGNTSLEIRPSNTFSEAGEYDISLIVQDQYGCRGEITKPVEVILPCKVVLPNAFSPNGDLINDTIGVLGDPEEMDWIIYNRWGEAIFRSTSVSHRWDGTYLGNEVPIGVYPYSLKYTCLDKTGEVVEEQDVGEINLIR